MRGRNVVVAAIVVVAGLAVLGAVTGTKDDPAAAARTAATLAGNVRDSWGTADWYGTLKQKNNGPDIEVVTTTAFVFTNVANTDLGKANALTICRDVAAVSNDPNTAASLGLRHVEVDGGTGNQQLATCDTP